VALCRETRLITRRFPTVKVNLEAIANKIKALIEHPFASLMQFLIFTAWIMAVLIAWTAIYRQLHFVTSFPFIRSATNSLDLVYSFLPLALLYFVPRR